MQNLCFIIKDLLIKNKYIIQCKDHVRESFQLLCSIMHKWHLFDILISFSYSRELEFKVWQISIIGMNVDEGGAICQEIPIWSNFTLYAKSMFIPYRHFERSRIDCKHPKSAECARKVGGGGNRDGVNKSWRSEIEDEAEDPAKERG